VTYFGAMVAHPSSKQDFPVQFRLVTMSFPCFLFKETYMYGESDSHWDSEYFSMKAIAEEQLELLKKLLSEIKDPELIKTTALAIVDFSQRIAAIS
jgi:hypothetical protein